MNSCRALALVAAAVLLLCGEPALAARLNTTVFTADVPGADWAMREEGNVVIYSSPDGQYHIRLLLMEYAAGSLPLVARDRAEGDIRQLGETSCLYELIAGRIREWAGMLPDGTTVMLSVGKPWPGMEHFWNSLQAASPAYAPLVAELRLQEVRDWFMGVSPAPQAQAASPKPKAEVAKPQEIAIGSLRAQVPADWSREAHADGSVYFQAPQGREGGFVHAFVIPLQQNSHEAFLAAAKAAAEQHKGRNVRTVEGMIEFVCGDAGQVSGLCQWYGFTALVVLYPEGDPVSTKLMRSLYVMR